MKVIVRQARFDDAEVLTELSIRSKASNGYDEAVMKACREELTVTPSGIGRGEYWIAEADIICGCVGLAEDPEGKTGEVHTFFVDPNFKRCGIGRKLWQQVLQLAKEKGITKLRLDADPNAVSFYEAMGFVITSQVPSGSIEGRMLPRMENQLNREN